MCITYFSFQMQCTSGRLCISLDAHRSMDTAWRIPCNSYSRHIFTLSIILYHLYLIIQVLYIWSCTYQFGNIIISISFWRLASSDIVSWIPYHRLLVTESVEFNGMCRFWSGDSGLLSLFYVWSFTTFSSRMFQSLSYHLSKCKF